MILPCENKLLWGENTVEVGVLLIVLLVDCLRASKGRWGAAIVWLECRYSKSWLWASQRSSVESGLRIRQVTLHHENRAFQKTESRKCLTPRSWLRAHWSWDVVSPTAYCQSRESAFDFWEWLHHYRGGQTLGIKRANWPWAESPFRRTGESEWKTKQAEGRTNKSNNLCTKVGNHSCAVPMWWLVPWTMSNQKLEYTDLASCHQTCHALQEVIDLTQAGRTAIEGSPAIGGLALTSPSQARIASSVSVLPVLWSVLILTSTTHILPASEGAQTDVCIYLAALSVKLSTTTSWVGRCPLWGSRHMSKDLNCLFKGWIAATKCSGGFHTSSLAIFRH